VRCSSARQALKLVANTSHVVILHHVVLWCQGLPLIFEWESDAPAVLHQKPAWSGPQAMQLQCGKSCACPGACQGVCHPAAPLSMSSC